MSRWPPTADEITELPADALGIRMLRHFAEEPERQFHRNNDATNSSTWSRAGREYTDVKVLRARGEAYDWLVFNALLAVKPGEASGFTYITKRGRTAAGDSQAVAKIRATRRLDVDMHPLLAERVRRQFLLGEYESAVLLAFRKVEIRVRDLSGSDDSMIGVPLMQEALSPDKNGPLVNTSLERGEQLATMYLFAGAIGAFKNPSSHRQVDYGDPTVAAEAILLADLLMRLLDRYET